MMMTSRALKWIAVCTMLIDHVGVVLNTLARYQLAGGAFYTFATDDYMWMRAVGRAAFPLYAFLIAEGCAHTRSAGRYILRLLGFGLLSQVPFGLFYRVSSGQSLLGLTHGNVMFTLGLGALAVLCAQKLLARQPLWLLGILGCYVLVYFLQSEYGFLGISLILLLYLLRPGAVRLGPAGKITGAVYLQALACAALMGIFYSYSLWYALGGMAAGGLIAFYRGRPGGRGGKYFFYLFYPVHLLLLTAWLYVSLYGPTLPQLW